MTKKLQILIVDDEKIIQKLFRDFLADEYDVHFAGDGEEALGVIKRMQIDVVFSDVHMPKMGGIEVLKSVRANFPDIPVIMMDSFPEISSQEMSDMGAFAFIHKPFYLREIKGVLKEVIQSEVSESKFSGANRRKEKRFPSVLEITYKIEDIAVIIHNHLKGCKFSPTDKRLHWRLKKYGFRGRFLLYSHTTNKTYDKNVIPAYADQTVIQWGIMKKIGDTITYFNEKGEKINLVLVGGLNASIFQGNILISEKNFQIQD